MSAARLTNPNATTARHGDQARGAGRGLPCSGPGPLSVDVTASSCLHHHLPTVRSMDRELAVDAVDLTKRYGQLVAVDNLSLQVTAGEVYGVLGPNGAGKTTLLRMLFGLIRPDDGTMRVFGKTWAEAGVGVLDGVAGFIESPRFYPYLTGRQNLDGLALLDGGVRPGRVDEVLEVVDLVGREHDKVAGYSFGMRQRLGVAASLLRDPRLL